MAHSRISYHKTLTKAFEAQYHENTDEWTLDNEMRRSSSWQLKKW